MIARVSLLLEPMVWTRICNTKPSLRISMHVSHFFSPVLPTPGGEDHGSRQEPNTWPGRVFPCAEALIMPVVSQHGAGVNTI